ncbi:MAG: hypothetical protein ACXACI_02660 [Candidatus Hodarchaeales archaeon]|jgi:hypothetical protein
MREIEKNRMYKMQWEYTQEQFGKGEVFLTGNLTYTVKALDKLQAQLDISIVDDLNHHIGYVLKDLIANALEFTSGFDLIAKQSMVLHRIELEMRQKLIAELAIELVDIHLVDVWFYGVEETKETAE